MTSRRIGLVSVLAALALAASSGTAAAASWDRLGNCPVDNAAMLAVPAGQVSGCATFMLGLGVSFNLGRVSWHNCGCGTYPGFDLRFGFGGDDPFNSGMSNGFPATDGTTFTGNSTDYSTYPWSWLLGSGSLGLLDHVLRPVCGALKPGTRYTALGDLCYELDYQSDVLGNQSLNVEVIFKSAGTPTDFSPANAGATGSLLTIPLRLQLKNLLFGNSCYVGSSSSPILIHLRQTSAPEYKSRVADPDGYPVELYSYEIAGQSDDTFSEPAATGCGPGGLLDSFVNGQLDLPSAAGDNHLSVPNEELDIATTTAGGAVLSQAWHAFYAPSKSDKRGRRRGRRSHRSH